MASTFAAAGWLETFLEFKEQQMSDIDLGRIIPPLRLAKGSHQPGSGKGCAMNVISYINGDVEITDVPECSAPALARIVQAVNDYLADIHGDEGYNLSPEDSVIALNLERAG